MAEKDKDDKPIKTLTAEDIRLLKTVRSGSAIALVAGWCNLTVLLLQPLQRSDWGRASAELQSSRRLLRPAGAAQVNLWFVVQYGAGPYSAKIKKLEGDIKDIAKKVNEVSGVKESDTGLAHPSRWDLVSDKQAQQEEHPLQVRAAVCVVGDTSTTVSCLCRLLTRLAAGLALLLFTLPTPAALVATARHPVPRIVPAHPAPCCLRPRSLIPCI
jgi:hypothetical protein